MDDCVWLGFGFCSNCKCEKYVSVSSEEGSEIIKRWFDLSDQAVVPLRTAFAREYGIKTHQDSVNDHINSIIASELKMRDIDFQMEDGVNDDGFINILFFNDDNDFMVGCYFEFTAGKPELYIVSVSIKAKESEEFIKTKIDGIDISLSDLKKEIRNNFSSFID